MKVVFTGAQGVGKTTLLDILEKCFTLPVPFTFIRNFTRNIAKSGYTINEDGTDNTQLTIMKLHKSCIDRVDNVIMDRCALDGFVYTTYLYRQGKISREVYERCESIFRECIYNYNIIYYLVPEFPITGDEYRSAKEDYQKAIADIFEEMIEKYRINVVKLTGTVGDRLSKIQKTLGGVVKC